MRVDIKKKKSSKAERILHEILKSEKIRFRYKWIVGDMECDFVIGRYAIEVDGHSQNPLKNRKLIDLGYIPIHIENIEVKKNRENIRRFLRKKWQEQISAY